MHYQSRYIYDSDLRLIACSLVRCAPARVLMRCAVEAAEQLRALQEGGVLLLDVGSPAAFS